MEVIIFYTLAAATIISALLVITRVNPLMSALMLVACFLFTALIFATLSAPFIAVLQVLIYAGAIMVLFIFVIMLVHLDQKSLKPRIITFSKIIGASAALYLLLVFIISVWVPPFIQAPQVGAAFSSPASLGRELITKYIIPFEIISVLLLIAMIGVIVLAKKKI
ncbi:MAG: NADH-quinone oxidoreductase subunit J [Pseudomonadota bacterium]